jgi:hypothetical protein
MAINQKTLEDLLRRCSSFPWKLTMGDDEKWCILNSKEDLKRKVAFHLSGSNNYDKRLMAMAPELALELLKRMKQP